MQKFLSPLFSKNGRHSRKHHQSGDSASGSGTTSSSGKQQGTPTGETKPAKTSKTFKGSPFSSSFSKGWGLASKSCRGGGHGVHHGGDGRPSSDGEHYPSDGEQTPTNTDRSLASKQFDGGSSVGATGGATIKLRTWASEETSRPDRLTDLGRPQGVGPPGGMNVPRVERTSSCESPNRGVRDWDELGDLATSLGGLTSYSTMPMRPKGATASSSANSLCSSTSSLAKKRLGRGLFHNCRHAEDLIVTPFAQILASLRSVRQNYVTLTQATSSKDR